MGKKTPNQIREEVRRKMANKNKEELERARERVKAVWEQYRDAEERAKKYKAENETLKEKLAQLEDWNSRLMEFMDMPESERKYAVNEYMTNLQLNEELNQWFNKYISFFSPFFG